MDYPAAHGYAGVGATLRSARERGGLDAAQVAKTLRMQAAHLTAIEQGRFGELPGQVYALGFVRSYAEYLGFDGDAAVRRLKEEISGEEARQSPLTFPVPVGEARTPGPRLLLFAVLAAVAIYGTWVYWGRVQTGVAELVPPLPERLAKLIGDTPAPAIAAPSQPVPAQQAAQPAPAPTTASPPPPSPAPTPAPAPKAAVAAAPAPTPAPPAPVAPPPEVAPAPTIAAASPPPPPPSPAAAGVPPSPPLVAAAPVGAEVVPPPPPRPPEPPAQTPQVAALPVPPSFPTVPADGVAPAAPATPVVAATGNVYGVPAAESRVTLRAKSISWVQVRGSENEILITRTLRAGDTYHLPNRADMVMMTGSAGGLEVLVDGKPVPPLGAAGEVRRNIPLDPEKLTRLNQ